MSLTPSAQDKNRKDQLDRQKADAKKRKEGHLPKK